MVVRSSGPVGARADCESQKMLNIIVLHAAYM